MSVSVILGSQYKRLWNPMKWSLMAKLTKVTQRRKILCIKMLPFSHYTSKIDMWLKLSLELQPPRIIFIWKIQIHIPMHTLKSWILSLARLINDANSGVKINTQTFKLNYFPSKL